MQKLKYVIGLTLYLLSVSIVMADTLTARQEMLCQRDNINDVMQRIVRFQTDAFDGKIITDWKVGTFYTGVYAAYEATGDETFYKAAKAWCEAAKWKMSGSPFFADDICSAQTILDVYGKDKQPQMIASVQRELEQYFGKETVTKKEAVVTLWPEKERPLVGRNIWWWCDSLYMAPPVFARMSAVTGDKRYLDLMHTLYWDTKEYLYAPQEDLFYRDQRYFEAKTPNGQKMFWGRGNGWVYAGLMRMIDYIPDSDPKKDDYLALYQAMTRSILKYQQPDGLWRAGLNDPQWLPSKETSATSFFCYGLLAGINKGYLDRQSYLPPALKAWEGLLDCVSPEGRMGYAQLGDIGPNPVRPDDFVDYAHGAFLLAAAELYKVNLTADDFKKLRPPYQVKQICEDGAWTWFNDERAIVDGSLLLVGSLDSQGVSRVDQYALGQANGLFATIEYPLSSWQSKDDHNNPALLKLDNGKVLACYAKHHRDQKWYYRLADKQGTRYAWGPEKTFELPAYTTYNNLCQLKNENGRIYNFSRNLNFNPNLQYSDDQAESWQGPFTVIKSGNGRTRPYVKYADNGTDRIDLLYTDGHPRNEPANNVYHLYYQKGGFYQSDGTLIKTLDQVKKEPMVPADGTKIYDGSTAGRGWVWDIEYDANGSPVTAFINSVDHAVGNDLRYRYGRFDPKTKKWTQQQIAFAGTHLYDGEDHYAGGICIDPENTQIVYISTDVDPATGKPNATGRCQIFQGKISDEGKTWAWKQLTFDATVDNLRPIVPRHHGRSICVIWFQGQYRTYEQFETRIMGIIEK